MRSEGEVLYLVTCHGTHSVDVYDDRSKLMCTFGGRGKEDGQMMYPWGTTFTKQGILVADQFNHRISLYSTEGKFLKQIVTSNDEIQFPLGLLFIRPCLWLALNNPPSVKCYILCQ